MIKKFMSLFLAIVMCLTLPIPASATVLQSTKNLPPWVEDGEQWFPSNGIMPLDDFGNCPKGHSCPSGFTYQGYTMGEATGRYSPLEAVLTIISVFSKATIDIRATALSAVFFAVVNEFQDTNVTYFKYVYTRGSTTWYHIVYSETYTDSPRYTYLTCETFYG